MSWFKNFFVSGEKVGAEKQKTTPRDRYVLVKVESSTAEVLRDTRLVKSLRELNLSMEQVVFQRSFVHFNHNGEECSGRCFLMLVDDECELITLNEPREAKAEEEAA